MQNGEECVSFEGKELLFLCIHNYTDEMDDRQIPDESDYVCVKVGATQFVLHF